MNVAKMDNHRTGAHEKDNNKILRDMRKNHLYYQEITPTADVDLCISFFECAKNSVRTVKLEKEKKNCSTK